MRKERDSIPRIQDRKEKTMVELESSGILHKEKNTAEQYMDKNSKKHSKREDQPKGYQENIPDVKKGVSN